MFKLIKMDALEQLQMEYKKTKKPAILTDDIVLSLLATHPNIPIQNRTVIMKEVFLTYKEIIESELDSTDIKIVDPEFFAYQFGAFSWKIAETISLLVNNGLVERAGRVKGNGETFRITEKGKKALEVSITGDKADYMEKLLDKLKSKRKSWDQFGKEGLLNYTYKLYPEYSEKSRIKNKYKVSPWAELFKE